MRGLLGTEITKFVNFELMGNKLLQGFPQKVLETFRFTKQLQDGSSKWCVLLATMEEEGSSEQLSDPSEVLLHCSVAISNSKRMECFIGTHSTAIETLFLCSIPCTTYFPILVIII